MSEPEAESHHEIARRPVAGEAPGGVPVKTEGWLLKPFADSSAAFVFSSSPIRVSVLDPAAWFVLENCDGRPTDQIVARLTRLQPARGAVAERLVESRLGLLRTMGLIRYQGES